VSITFKDKDAKKVFDDAQSAYSNAVSDIRSANQIEAFPTNGTPQQKTHWMGNAKQANLELICKFFYLDRLQPNKLLMMPKEITSNMR
jgi:hypothetical protein